MEPHIAINGVWLSEGQAMTLRVALNSFMMQLGDQKFAEALGLELSRNYFLRAGEVMNYMIGDRGEQSNPAKP